MAGVLGLEPRLAAPEAAVLPLDDTPTPLFERQRLASRLDAPPEATLKILERFGSVNRNSAVQIGTVRPSGVTHAHEVERLLEVWIDTLSEREKDVLQGRFGLHDREPETLEVLSARLGLTRERVRQVQNEALCKLKRYLGRRGITREALL